MSEPRLANEVVGLTAEQMPRTITRIAHEILEKNPGDAKLAVVGIHTRGAFLGDRIHKLLCEVGGRQYDKGDLDISFYRDDVAAPRSGPSRCAWSPRSPQHCRTCRSSAWAA